MAMDDCDPRITPVELKLERHGTMAQKILVLVDDGEDEFCPQAITRPYIQVSYNQLGQDSVVLTSI